MTTTQRLSQSDANTTPLHTPFSQSIGRTRYIVLLAVAAVLLVAVSLFLLGTLQAVVSVWHT